MELAPTNVALSFEVTFDRNDLHVGMSVYDDSGANPVLISGPTAMALVTDYTYRGKFTPSATKPYIIIKAVYTNSSLNVLSPDYAQGSESIIAQELSGGGGGGGGNSGDLIGLVENNVVIFGLINC